ncbi:MAG: hypothetical protein P1U46_03410 [Patescibacteria group bacterium]|nr:hypothetical protein [Patescibacteria group bacterium]
MNKKNKFGIKTRVFLAFPFFVIIITNIFATFLYIFIEKSFINNVKNDIDNLYEKIEINLEKQNGSKILNINESLENEVQNK